MRRTLTLSGLLLALAIIPQLIAAGTSLAESVDGAPGFSIRDLDGRTFRLSDFKGKPVILDFWATWCRPCRASLPNLDRLQQRYRSQGLVVLGLSLDDFGPTGVRRFANDWGVRFRLAMADQRVLDLYGPIRSIPTTVFINRQGMVIRRVVGYVDGETLEIYARELF